MTGRVKANAGQRRILKECQHVCSFEGASLYSSLAQSVEHAAVNRSVVGSSPTGGVSEHEADIKFHTWLHGQVVKTPPFHGGNRGSNPLGVIFLNILAYNKVWRHSQVVRQRSATPLSPVRIWLAPLQTS